LFETIDDAWFSLPFEPSTQLPIAVTRDAGHVPKEWAIHVEIGLSPVMAVEDIEELSTQAELIALGSAKAEELGDIQVLIRETKVFEIAHIGEVFGRESPLRGLGESACIERETAWVGSISAALNPSWVIAFEGTAREAHVRVSLSKDSRPAWVLHWRHDGR